MSTSSSEPAAPAAKSMDDIVALCRRRGFIFQSSEIYGGINGFWDYGPLGTILKRNLKNAWWEDIVQKELTGPDGRPIDIVGLDTTIIMHPKVWEASGHVAGFNDPMVDDKETQQRFRADQFVLVHLVPLGEDYQRRVDQFQAAATDMFIGDYMPVEKPIASVIAANAAEAKRIVLGNFKSIPFARGVKERIKKIVDLDETQTEGRESSIAVKMRDGSIALLWFGHLAADLLGDFIRNLNNSIPSPFTGNYGTLTEPRQFNLMFKTYVGAVQDEDSIAYLRPETAQGIFVNFWNVVDTSRVRVPFGIAQIGKAFRNEVTPRNFTFRSREFEQMEVEFFIPPEEKCREGDLKPRDWYDWWRDERYRWWQSIGLAGDNLQLREHEKDELAHYAKEGAGTSDIEYRFPFTAPGFGELEGVAHRADYDLRAHANACGKGDKLQYFDQEKNDRYFPHVIEPSGGADRGTLAILCEAYTPDDSRPSKVFMKFSPRLAPIKAAVFPLVNKDGMPNVAEKLYRTLRKRWMIQYDAKQSIGKRYARMDEAGTPWCFTIDGDTLQDQTVTVRERDTQSQERIAIDQVERYLAERIGG